MLKLNELEPTLRRRIQAQIDQEDAAKNTKPMAGRLHTQKPEPNRRGQGQDSALEEGQDRTGYRITITVYRRRLLDSHDNARSSCKPLVDRITTLLGFHSDDCRELAWCYHQVKSQTKGTHVLIEQCNPIEKI